MTPTVITFKYISFRIRFISIHMCVYVEHVVLVRHNKQAKSTKASTTEQQNTTPF